MIILTQVMEVVVFSFDSFREFLTQRHWQKGEALDFPTRKLDKLTLSCSTLLIFFQKNLHIFLIGLDTEIL